jgi:hypothetical protein
MTTRTAEEAKAHYIEKMGGALGTQFAALWSEVEGLHVMWGEYVELFTQPDSVDVLNQTAPGLFRIIQVVLWEYTLLQIARLTDPPDSGKDKENLTILNLPGLVEYPGDDEKRANLDGLIGTVMNKTKFCRDWRNRHIAHRDLNLLVNESAKPLERASGIQVEDALSAIGNVISEVHLHYMDSWLIFSRNASGAGTALSLLQLLRSGLRARAIAAATTALNSP